MPFAEVNLALLFCGFVGVLAAIFLLLFLKFPSSIFHEFDLKWLLFSLGLTMKTETSNKKNRRRFIRNTIEVGAGLGIAGLVGSMLQSRNEQVTQISVRTADIVIFISGSNIEAIDGLTGAVISGNTGASTVIQAAVNALTTGGSIYIKAGIYNLTTTITLPYGLSFYFYGDGVPSWQEAQVPGTTYATPTDGTQIRGTSALNSLRGNVGIFTRTQGSSHRAGTLSFSHLAIMPAWGTTTNNTSVVCVYDIGASYFGSKNHLYDDVEFVPWGWAEAGSPNPSSGGTNNFNSLRVGLDGAHTLIKGTNIRIMGMVEQVALLYADYIHVDLLYYNICYQGLTMEGISGFYIDELECDYVPNYYLTLQSGDTHGASAAINRIGKIFSESTGPTTLIHLSNSTPTLSIGFIFMWQGRIWTSITDADSTNLLYPCFVYTGGDAEAEIRTYPIPSADSTPFGDTISNPINSTNKTIGTGGTTSTLVSGQAYAVNVPIDVTIGAGTGQTITTKDGHGNTVDNGVATLTHRLLHHGWTITVTFSAVGSVAVVQGTVGSVQGIAGTTATPQANVNYLVVKRLFITAQGGSATMTTLNGSGNTGGTTMDSALPVPVYRYLLECPQIVVFPVVPSSISVVQQ